MVEFIITGSPQREERFDYPEDAIREIVINMIIHRDYRESNGSIIKIYDDRIEFYNPGKLIGNLTIKDLLSDNHTSMARNKLIAKTFKEIGKIERYGSGIKRILDICKNYGIIPPKFEEVFNGFKVILYKEKTDQKTDQKKSVVELMISNPNITISEIAFEIGKGLTATKTEISKLKATNKIRRVGPDKGGYWEVIK